MLGRPHFHACLFGIDFHWDRVPCLNSTAKPGSVEWTSRSLDRIWKRGFATLGPLNYATASYTAGYVLKKKTREEHAKLHGVFTMTPEEAEIPKQEFNTMSTKPGLGHDWFQKYWSDVYPSDSVELNGLSFRPPSYYDELLKKRDPALWHRVSEKRKEFVEERGLTDDYTLEAKRVIHAAKQRDSKERLDL